MTKEKNIYKDWGLILVQIHLPGQMWFMPN